MANDIRQITVNGATLGYEIHGEGSGKSPAIFVHGYSGRGTGGAAYPELIDALSAEFTVYVLDARGHGASANEVETFSISAVADDVVSFARELGLTRPVYVGHSFGAMAGLYGEVRHPGSFGALCMIAPADAGIGEHKSNGDLAAVMIEHGRNVAVMRPALEPMYIRDPDLAQRQAESLAVMDPRVHALFFSEYSSLSFIDRLADVKAPVLFVNGGQDLVVPLAAQHETALALSNCKEVNFLAEGHMIPVELGEVVAQEIIRFWTFDVGKAIASA